MLIKLNQNHINLQKQLNKIEIEEINGYMIRTKLPNFEKAEPNIKFYADIEKKQGNKNIISSLKDKEGNVKSNTKEILHIATTFYNDLYKKEKVDEKIQKDLINKIDKKLTETQKINLEKEITMKELEEAAFDLPIDKTPGKNGLPVEFFTTYWESLKDLYFKYINYVKHHEISEKQNTSITKIIHKKDDLANYNYRPIPIALINARY